MVAWVTDSTESSAPQTAVLDEAALETLYVRLEKPLYNVVYRWVWDAETAHDVVQEAFLRLWRMRERIDMTTVEPLVYRIALNLAANRRRAQKIRRFVTLQVIAELRSRSPGPHEALERARREHALRSAIDGLPERLRRVVTLCEFSDMTYAEIADSLGIATGTVGSRRNEALQRLREMLGDWEDDDE